MTKPSNIDDFIILSVFVREVATIEQVEAINKLMEPLNRAILERLKPQKTTVN